MCEKSANFKITLCLHFFAHSPFLKEQQCDLFKVQKSTNFKIALFSHFFAHFCTFAHFEIAIVRSDFFVAL